MAVRISSSILPSAIFLLLLLFLRRFDVSGANNVVFDDDDDDDDDDVKGTSKDKNLDLMQRFRKRQKEATNQCCPTCVQPFDWHRSPGSIACDEHFGPERKCQGACMLLVVKHVDPTETTTTTTAMTATTANTTKTVVTIVEKKEKPLLWRFCTKKQAVKNGSYRPRIEAIELQLAF